MFDELISIVIPTFNSSRSIVDTLNSVLSQSYLKIEVIIVDDGSLDDTVELLKGALDDRCLLVVLGDNMGGSHARNRGIDLASGAYICLLDSDDIWLPDKILCQYQAVQSFLGPKDTLIVYNAILLETERGDYVRPDYPFESCGRIDEYISWKKQYIQTSGILASSSLLKRVKFDEKLRKHQDIDLVLSLHQAGASFVFCDLPNVIYKNNLLDGRVSLAKRPERTIQFMEKWKDSLSPKTKAFYYSSIVCPMLVRESPLVALRYWAKGLPFSLLFIKDLAEGLFMYQVSPNVFNRVRLVYRTVFFRK